MKNERYLKPSVVGRYEIVSEPFFVALARAVGVYIGYKIASAYLNLLSQATWSTAEPSINALKGSY